MDMHATVQTVQTEHLRNICHACEKTLADGSNTRITTCSGYRFHEGCSSIHRQSRGVNQRACNTYDPKTESLFLRACQTGDLNALKEVWSTSQNMICQDYLSPNSEKNHILLSIAAQKGHTEIAQWLLDHGAEVDATREDGATALHLAAREGQAKAVEWLINAGANVNSCRNDGGTALQFAAQKGDAKVVKLLFEAGANNAPGESSPLNLAAGGGHVDVVKLLFDNKPDLCTTPEWKTVLQIAASAGHAKLVQWLINSVCIDLPTGLHFAAWGGHVNVMELLLGAGANVDTVSARGHTALSVAAQAGHADVVAQLLNAGANVNTVFEGGYTALSAAAQKGHADVVTLLLGAMEEVDPANTTNINHKYLTQCRRQ